MTAEAFNAPLTPYLWQTEEWGYLNRLVASGRLPHAMLFSGYAGVGKQRFAHAFAQFLLCEMPLSEGGCGACKQCRLSVADTHPDLLQLAPEAPGKAIRVDDIRRLDDFIAKTAQQGGWKIIIINPADAMNLNAANALLKNLEEPGEKTLLLLLSSAPDRIPATIRSRCQKLNFKLPEKKLVRQWLHQVTGDESNIDTLIHHANGRPLLALRMLEQDLLSRQQEFYSRVEAILSGQRLPLEVANWCKGEDSLQLLEWLQCYTMALVKENQNNTAHRVAFLFMDKMVEVKRRLLGGSNPNLQLLWEELMLDWQVLGRRLQGC